MTAQKKKQTSWAESASGSSGGGGVTVTQGAFLTGLILMGLFAYGLTNDGSPKLMNNLPLLAQGSLLGGRMVDVVPMESILPIQRKVVTATGYSGSFEQVVMNGNESFKITNRVGDTINARLVRGSSPSDRAVRDFFVITGQSIDLHRLDAGIYVMRYELLSDGSLFETRPFLVGPRLDGRIEIGITVSMSSSHNPDNNASIRREQFNQ